MDKVSLIWDVDGTLFDTYNEILMILVRMFSRFGMFPDPEWMLQFIKQSSVSHLIDSLSSDSGLDAKSLKEEYYRTAETDTLNCRPMKHAEKALRDTAALGAEHYIFTHRGNSAFQLLSGSGLESLFRDVVTAEQGFPRKPDPDGIYYLMDKYALNPSRSFYVGDRPIDMQCASKAGIGGILFLPEEDLDISCEEADFVVNDLLYIVEILEMI